MTLSKKTKNALIAVSIIAPFAVVVVGCILPQTHEIFYTNFIWKHIWGPTVADVEGHHVAYHGTVANEGYTITSELVYGLILVLCLVGIYRILNTLRIRVDEHFIYTLMPFIVLGPVLRVFEDAWLFRPPVQYIFITPWIFFLMGAMVLLFILVGARIRDLKLRMQVIYFGSVMAIADCIYAYSYISFSGQMAYWVHPAFVILYSLIAVVVFFLLSRKWADPMNTALCFGFFTMMLSGHIISHWAGNPWSQPISEPQPMLIPIVLGISGIIAFIFWFSARMASHRYPALSPFSAPVNLLMVFGHQVDAWSSTIAINFPNFLGLQLASYGEKHPMSEFFLNQAGGYGFIIIKLVLIVLIMYLIDIASKEDMERHPVIKTLIKLTIISLGMGPGIRNFLRAAMAV